MNPIVMYWVKFS